MNNKEKFVPPSIPIKWLCGTFVSPLLVVAAPSLMMEKDLSLEVKVAVALGVFSALLLASCVYLILKLYELAFAIQIQKYETECLHKTMTDLSEKSNLHVQEFAELANKISDYESRLAKVSRLINKDNP